jgi:hypothetical protein
METFKYSIIYLMALFVIMMADHYIYPLETRQSGPEPSMFEIVPITVPQAAPAEPAANGSTAPLQSGFIPLTEA